MMHARTVGDGREIRIRPIGRNDLALEQEFVEGLSRETAYQRLMSARRPSLDEIRRWTEVDHVNEVALIATATVDGREQQVAVARYVRDADEAQAEFAIVVGDAWQRRGVGRQLLCALLDAARRAGLRRLFGMTFSDNGGMLKLARALGFRLRKEPGSAFLTNVVCDLAEDSRVVAAPARFTWRPTRPGAAHGQRA